MKIRDVIGKPLGRSSPRERSVRLTASAMSSLPRGMQRGKEKPGEGPDDLDVLLQQATQLYVSLTEQPPSPSPLLPKTDKTRGQDFYRSTTTSNKTTTPLPTNAVIQSAMANVNASPPPRPSRANTDNLNDVFASQPPSLAAQRRTSVPIPVNQHGVFYADPNEQLPSIASTSQSPSQIRSRASTTKGKKGVLGFMSEFLSPQKTVAISTPYDPVHLTHVGFNSSTGEFTGLPKEWQQLLQESGISRMEQEKNPQAVMEIVKFYQEGGGDVWDKMGAVSAPPRDDTDTTGALQSPVSHLAITVLCMRNPQWLVQAPRSCPAQENAIQPFPSTHFLQTSTYTTPGCLSFSGSVHVSTSPSQTFRSESTTFQVEHDQRFTSPWATKWSHPSPWKTPTEISCLFDNRSAFETAEQRSGKNPTTTESRCQPVT